MRVHHWGSRSGAANLQLCCPPTQYQDDADFAVETSTTEEIKEAGIESLKCNLGYSSPITFLRGISRADGFDAQSRAVAKYLIEFPK
jgi:hypothetical protein